MSSKKLALIIIPVIAFGVVGTGISPVFAEATTENTLKPLQTLNQEKNAIPTEPKHAVGEIIQAQRENFKNKLAEIKDARKRMVVEKIDAKIAERNNVRTSEMLKNIEKMQGIVSRVRQKISILESSANKTACETALNSADLTLTSIKDAVTTQAGQTYVLQITTEQVLGQTVNQLILSYKTDIKALFQKVVTAKEITLNTVVTCKPLLLERSATVSAEPKNYEQ